MELFFSDNIIAEMTPHGRAAVSGLRISGPDVKSIIEKSLNINLKKPRYAYHINHELDDLVVVYYKAPYSYTGQDVCEIFCHGNPTVVNAITDLLIGFKGFKIRTANPGEFTKIAYLNGKMDLMQAESVVDLINSSTKKAAELRGKTLRGDLSNNIVAIKKRLLDLAVRSELEIDFDEDRAGVFNYEAGLKELIALKDITDGLLRSFKNIEKLSGDIKVLITGKANVGKSSLFNKILEYERSIVHHLPGTTRDYIEAELMLGDVEIVLIDTAGLRDGYDSDVEEMGAKKIHDLTKEAFIIIEVSTDDNCVSNLGKTIVVRNKMDLVKPKIKQKNIIYTCAYTGEGIKELKLELEKRIKDHIKIADDRDDIFLFNKRQVLLISKLSDSLESTIVAIKKESNVDIISFLITNCIHVVDELLGKDHITDEVLDELFSRFCIGK